MAAIKVWTILLVLISLHGNSDSQTDMTVTMIATEIMGTAPTTFRTIPPPPPTSITPPPPSTSVEPPITTRTPPPPPPPSSPPPPPSSTVPPSPTPPSTTSSPPTLILTTTGAIEPTTQTLKTEPINIEPNPVAESLGKIGVLIAVALEEFDRQQFKEVIAQEVNNYCTEFSGQCVGEGKTVSAKDVVIVTVVNYEQSVGDGAKRRLLQEEQIMVEYYVQDPVLSTNVMLTTEQQRVFLANEDVDNALQSNIDGYNGIAPDYAEPINEAGLEGWEIALIVIGSVAAVGLVIGGIAYHMSYNKAHAKHIDLELQESKTTTVMEHTGNDYSTVVTNGLTEAKVKPSVDEINVATQVKYKDIVAETGFEAVKGERKEEEKPNGGTSLIVTADIASSSSGSSTSSDHGEIDATAEEHQEIPPDYESPQPTTAMDSGTEEIQEQEAQVVNDLDKLIASQTEELTVNSTAFKNPGFLASTEASTHPE